VVCLDTKVTVVNSGHDARGYQGAVEEKSLYPDEKRRCKNKRW
jgi:hypothetical protein